MDKFKRDLILLNMIEDIGYIKLKALLKKFKEPGNILRASLSELRSVKGIGEKIAFGIKNAVSDYDIDEEISLIEKSSIRILTLFDKDYPENLKNIYDPPFVLYVKGSVIAKDMVSVAIVGSRRCTYYGMNMASKIAQSLSENGVTVVSGLARGIDTSAHKGALRGGCPTIAVLGSGLGMVYPSQNRLLSENIAKHGAVISEFPMAMKPYKKNFPRRNRLISGLSKAVLVVEASLKSGALITADFALEQGRDVFAVPGQADSMLSQGSNRLIKQGAKLIETADDILEEIGIVPLRGIKNNPVEKSLLNEDEIRLLSMFSEQPFHIDDIIRSIGIGNSSAAEKLLLDLRVKGFVEYLPGRYYIKTGKST
jgi:DNA processing protein